MESCPFTSEKNFLLQGLDNLTFFQNQPLRDTCAIGDWLIGL